MSRWEHVWLRLAVDAQSSTDERPADALPDAPALNMSLAEPGLRVVLARAAAEMNYLLLIP